MRNSQLSYTTASAREPHKILKHQFRILHSSPILGNADGASLPTLRIATHQSHSFCLLRAHNPWPAERGWQSCRGFGVLTFLYLWGKVNLSIVFWTAPRLTLPSLSSSCSSSCGTGTAAKHHQHCSRGMRSRHPTPSAGDQGSLLPFPWWKCPSNPNQPCFDDESEPWLLGS